MRRLETSFQMQRASAKVRGVRFLLTFEQWLKIWQDSGHFHERGRKGHQYVMARFKDRGAYKVGNVKVIKQIENILEGNVGKKRSPESIRKTAEKNRGRKRSLETRLKISAALIGRPGTKKSAVTRLKMSEYAYKRIRSTNGQFL